MKTFLSLLTILMIAAPFAHAADPADDSLILYFSFDELDGDTVPDLSQYENDGTIAGAPELAAGKFGNALKFNGESDWVEVPHADILTVDTNVTVMAWINAERYTGGTAGAQWQGILAKGDAPGPRSYSFYTESTGECLHFSAGGPWTGSTCTGKIELNEWTHVVAQFEDGVHRYWLNGEHAGESDGKNPLPGAADTASVLIGKTHESNREFLGLIDEVRIWNRALSMDEIRVEMETASTPVEPLNYVEADSQPTTRFTVEPDDHSNTLAGATMLYFGDDFTGEINPSSDVDYFKVEAPESGELTVYSTGNPWNNVDLVGQLLDANGSHLATSTNDGTGPNFRIVYHIDKGTYYVKVTEFNNDSTGKYRIYANFTPLEESNYSYRPFFPRTEDSHAEPVTCVAYSLPDGEVLVAGDNSGYLHVWDPTKGTRATKIATLLGENDHYGDVRSIAFSPDGNWCAVGTAWQLGDGGGYILVYKKNRDTWAHVSAWKRSQEPIHLAVTIRSIAFSPDSKLMACGTDNKVGLFPKNHKETILFEIDQGNWKNLKKNLKHGDNVTSVAFHPTKHHLLASGDDDEKVLLWNTTTNDSTELSVGSKVECIAFSPDGERLAVGIKNHIRLFSEADGKWDSQLHFGEQHDGVVLSLAFHPSGDVLMSGGDDGYLRFWNGQTLDSLTELTGVFTKISSITFSPKGNALAISNEGSRQVIGTWGEEIKTLVYQFPYAGTAGFTNKANFNLDIPANLISEVAYSENATYFVLNLQKTRVTGDKQTRFFRNDCIVTLDLPDVEQAPVFDEEDSRLDNPLYFMYSLQTPRQRIEVVEAEGTGDTQFTIITSVIGGGVGATIGFAIGSVLPGGGSLFGAGVGAFAGQLTARVIGSAAGTLIGVGLRKLGKEDAENPTKEEMILAETADPFFLLRPTKDSDSDEDRYRVLFLIKKRITEIGVKVEQGYRLESDGPVYVAKYTRVLNLESGTWSAPSARPMALADYPPFQELPPEEQAYLLQHFGKSVNVNVEELQIPEKTSLLPNYPNPFNPETWIPYQLTEPADVQLTIYDIKGNIVRALDLGHQRAGIYQDKSRAAYWDGRNEIGEPVASGVYFYTLTAGEFTATRKMLIRK